MEMEIEKVEIERILVDQIGLSLRQLSSRFSSAPLTEKKIREILERKESKKIIDNPPQTNFIWEIVKNSPKLVLSYNDPNLFPLDLFPVDLIDITEEAALTSAFEYVKLFNPRAKFYVAFYILSHYSDQKVLLRFIKEIPNAKNYLVGNFDTDFTRYEEHWAFILEAFKDEIAASSNDLEVLLRQGKIELVKYFMRKGFFYLFLDGMNFFLSKSTLNIEQKISYIRIVMECFEGKIEISKYDIPNGFTKEIFIDICSKYLRSKLPGEKIPEDVRKFLQM